MSQANPAPGTGETYTPEAGSEKPQTKTLEKEDTKNESTTTQDQTKEDPTPEALPADPVPGGLITLTQEQFATLISRLSSGQVNDMSPSPSFAPGGLQTNPFGQVIGTVTKFNVDPDYYPNPVEDLLADFDQDPRMRRFNLRENYFITFDITAKPYETKDHMSVQEPTFHLTLYLNEFDDQGEPTGRAIVIQTLHMNEDEQLARQFAAEEAIEVTDAGLKELMDRTRYARIRSWLIGIFFQPRNFTATEDSREEAIGGSVVKVVTKSNVKGFGNPTPKIEDEELS